MISRRHLLLTGAPALLLVPRLVLAQSSEAFGGPAFAAAIAAIEAKSGGRLGVAVRDTATGATFARRGDERFPMCSTFKFLLAAAVLAEVDAGRLRLDSTLPITKADLIAYSPMTESLVGTVASIAALCEAAVTLSDNTAANVLLKTLGGPAQLTAFLRRSGDSVTRLDRNEPTLNEGKPGDPRDTTTPLAMLGDLDRMVLGSVLTPASRQQLAQWLVANRTGDTRLRAGLPKDWRVGDKTGTGPRGSGINDIAVIWPPGRAPLLVTSYLTETALDTKAGHAVHMEVARALAAAVG